MAREREAKEREAKEREAKEREAKEREAKEREAKEREAKERLMGLVTASSLRWMLLSEPSVGEHCRPQAL